MSFKTRTLGILGGGQLGRMSALAAARLGIITHIYTPEQDSPAAQVSAKTIVGAWDDKKRLKEFADGVDVISYEFENIPLETVRFLKTLKPVYPDDNLLEIAQDRVKEKSFLNAIGIPTAKWAAVHSADEARAQGFQSFILKTTRFGYDGKGQVSIKPGDDIDAAWKQLNFPHIILEERIDFDYEISVIVARDKMRQIALYGPILNDHKNHILDRSVCPAPVPPAVAEKARGMTAHLAEAVDLVGVLALELFVTKGGDILANEIAPRTHNSGHWTIDACAVSQFEQHVRTVCALPVGFPAQHSAATLINLIGDDVKNLDQYIDQPGACIHLYGKREVKVGRKMGHVTILKQAEKL